MRSSDARYRLLFESTRDALMTLSQPLWLYSEANQATLELFGVATERAFTELSPSNFSPERQPDGRLSTEKAKEMIDTALRDGKILFEWTHRRLDGSTFPADVVLTRMSMGGEVFVQATVRDITERKRVERELAEASIGEKALIRLYATLSACNSAISHASSRHDLCERICQIAVDKGGWVAAWIGFLDETKMNIKAEACSKSMDPFINRMVVSVDAALPEGQGPTSIAARTGRPYYCNDVFTDPITLPWRGFLKKKRWSRVGGCRTSGDRKAIRRCDQSVLRAQRLLHA
jgi:PAS domain S-box-containing protein